MIVSARTIRILAIGVVFALALGSEAPLARDSSGPDVDVNASGHPDTAEAGALTARTDLKRGIRRVMVYGLVRDTKQIGRLRSLGYELLLGGCIVGGPRYEFWTGYNREMGLAEKSAPIRAIFKNTLL